MTTVKLTLGKCHLKINICAIMAILRLSHLVRNVGEVRYDSTDLVCAADLNIGELKMYGCVQLR